jgi:ABC-type transport system involved in multi-copper enzyme maturation permease subunit
VTAIPVIAANYLREQRWAVLLLMVWVVISAVLAGFGHLEQDDVLVFIKQQATYGVAFCAFLAASSIHNERRSRRILAVLSKGISRGQYLAGLLCGVLVAAAIYFLTMGAFGSVLFNLVGIPPLHLWQMLVLLFVASALSGTTSLLFATFAPPVVAMALAAVTLGGGLAASQLGATANFLPVYTLVRAVTDYSYSPRWTPPWTALVWGIVQTIAMWALAWWVFARRDVALAVE